MPSSLCCLDDNVCSDSVIASLTMDILFKGIVGHLHQSVASSEVEEFFSSFGEPVAEMLRNHEVMTQELFSFLEFL